MSKHVETIECLLSCERRIELAPRKVGDEKVDERVQTNGLYEVVET